MLLAAGTRLGPYEIVVPIGAGGMGEVYRARDTRLARDVAIKVLGASLSADPSSRLRFEQEARAAGALSHPNIVTVYDIGRSDDSIYVVSELLEGQTLRERLSEGPIPHRTVVEYGVQTSRGLAAAHEKGIVHRDLKPENIFLTKDGGLKILDFGLAKMPTARAAAEGTSDTPTQSMSTVPGIVMGTVGYMSPEQVRGYPVDARSDIFSFGVILYEALACEQAFTGESPADTLSAILSSDPPAMPSSVVLGLHMIVRRCLEKDPGRRFQTAQDVGFALEAIGGVKSNPPQQAVAAVRVWGRKATLAAAGWFLAGGLAAGGLLLLTLPRSEAVSVKQLAFAQITDDGGAEVYPSFAPGDVLVYASNAEGNWDISAKRLGERDAVNLTRDSPADDTQPSVSPDGRLIAFRSERDGGGIFVMDRQGRSVRRISNFGYNPSWSPDGKEVLCADESISRPDDRQLAVSRISAIDAAGGRARVIFAGDGVQPRWSPHGDRIAYWAIDRSGFRDIWTVPAGGGVPVAVTHDENTDWNPIWSPDGRYLYFASDRGDEMNLWRVPITEKTGKVLGPPEPVSVPTSYSGHLDYSRDGRHLAYSQQALTVSLKRVRFDPLTETVMSEPAEVLPSRQQAARPSLSPDGAWVAFNSVGKREDLFLVSTNGAAVRQLTDDGSKNRGPQFSPDGKRLAYFSKRSGTPEIWTVGLDGTPPQAVTALAGPNVAWPVWSPEGGRMIYTIFGTGSFLMDLGGMGRKQTPRALAADGTPFYAWSWSPDGKRVAGFQPRPDGSSSGILIYDVASGGLTRMTDYGGDPAWFSDSRRILFVRNSRMFLLDTATKRVKEVLSVAPGQIAARGFSISRDDRTVYFSVASTAADIWLVTFE